MRDSEDMPPRSAELESGRLEHSPENLDGLMQEMMAYIGLSERDCVLLQELLPVLEPHFDEMANKFYAFVARNPAMGRIIREGGHSFAKLEAGLRAWARGLFEGPYDESFASRSLRIGDVHSSLGVNQRYTAGAFNIVRTYLHRKVYEAGGPEVEDRLQALNRILDLDLCLIGEAYHARVRQSIVTEKDRQLLHQEKMAAIGLLAAGVAHEIGNPLASISSVTQTLQRKAEEPLVLEKLKLISQHISRINSIVQQMVDFARPPRQEWRTCDINAVVSQAVQILEYDRRAKNVRIETILDTELPSTVAIEDQLAQVFFNVAANALDALEKQETPSPQMRVETRLLGDSEPVIQIEFEDNGPGIPEEEASRIFEPFFTTKEVGRGTGLGLSVSYRIVEEHGGRIVVDGRPGRGARFTVYIPLRRPESRGTRTGALK